MYKQSNFNAQNQQTAYIILITHVSHKKFTEFHMNNKKRKVADSVSEFP